VLGVADTAGEAAGADVAGCATDGLTAVTFGLDVTVTVAAAVGLAGAVVAGVVEWLVVVAVRLGVGKLLITLLAVLPHPAARHVTIRIPARRERLFAGCRTLILSCCSPDQGTAVMIPPTRARRPHPLGGDLAGGALLSTFLGGLAMAPRRMPTIRPELRTMGRCDRAWVKAGRICGSPG
jgi:hypothetical protein